MTLLDTAFMLGDQALGDLLKMQSFETSLAAATFFTCVAVSNLPGEWIPLTFTPTASSHNEVGHCNTVQVPALRPSVLQRVPCGSYRSTFSKVPTPFLQVRARHERTTEEAWTGRHVACLAAWFGASIHEPFLWPGCLRFQKFPSHRHL